jgi:DNA-directed RNA polymerase specialized sigma24 family protein
VAMDNSHVLWPEVADLVQLSDSDVAAALQSLPQRSWILICLADVGGVRHRQIAEVTGIPEHAVASRLHRARVRLCMLLSVRRSAPRQ